MLIQFGNRNKLRARELQSVWIFKSWERKAWSCSTPRAVQAQVAPGCWPRSQEAGRSTGGTPGRKPWHKRLETLCWDCLNDGGKSHPQKNNYKRDADPSPGGGLFVGLEAGPPVARYSCLSSPPPDFVCCGHPHPLHVCALGKNEGGYESTSLLSCFATLCDALL